MEPVFTAAFTDQFGVALQDVRAPMQVAFERNAPVAVTVTNDLEEDAALALGAALRDGLPRLKLWRRSVLTDVSLPGALIVNAPWAPMEENGNGGDEVGRLQAQFRGPAASLDRRFTAAVQTYAAEDAGQIAWDLINTTQTAEGSVGIALGTIESTVARDRTYNDKQISDALNELTGVQGGFDFEVVPVDSGATCGTFNVYAHQGTDKSTGDQAVVFEYGPGTIGNVQKVTRQTDYPVNKALVIGANGLRSAQTDAASIAKYGTHETVEQAVDVSEQATLDAIALGLLRPDPIRVVSFTPDPALSPQPWDAFWLGDTVRLRARHGTLNLDIAVRVNGITLNIDEDGNVSSMELAVDQSV